MNLYLATGQLEASFQTRYLWTQVFATHIRLSSLVWEVMQHDSLISIYKPRVKTPLEALSHICFSRNETLQFTGAHHLSGYVLCMPLANHIIGQGSHHPEEGCRVWKAED